MTFGALNCIIQGMTYSFSTKPGAGHSETIPTSRDLTGYTLTAEFSADSSFSSVTTKPVTGNVRNVSLNLTAADADSLKDTYYRIKAVKDGKTTYVQTGVIDYVAPKSGGYDALVPREATATTNERLLYRDAPTFDASFTFDGIFGNADGAFVWRNMQVSGGYGGAIGSGEPISYFKAIGGSINHTGPGNLDAFWISVQHRGPREAGLFIGDITSRRGGNAYGGHTRVAVMPDAGYGAPLYHASWSHEIIVGAQRQAGQVAYGELIDIQGSYSASAAIQIGAQAHTGDKATSATSPVVYGINFDSTVSSPQATAIMIGGAWGSGINMNGNSIVATGSISGIGSTPNRDVRVADNLLIDNSRHIKFRDSTATARKVLGVTGSNNVRLIRPTAASQWEGYSEDESALLWRITSSGRGDFAAGGITTAHIGSAVPSGGSSGDVRVGNGKVWFNDAGTWKSVNIA